MLDCSCDLGLKEQLEAYLVILSLCLKCCSRSVARIQDSITCKDCEYSSCKWKLASIIKTRISLPNKIHVENFIPLVSVPSRDYLEFHFLLCLKEEGNGLNGVVREWMWNKAWQVDCFSSFQTCYLFLDGQGHGKYMQLTYPRFQPE